MTVKRYIKEYTHTVDSDDKNLYLDGVPQTIVLSNNTNCYLHGYYGEDKDKHRNSFLKVMAKLEITEVYSTSKSYHPVATYGFSKKDNKWYGWSHRGIFGFTIGSIVKKGDVAYNAANKEDYEEDTLNFFAGKDEPYLKNVRIEKIDDKSFKIIAEYTDNVPNKILRNRSYTHIEEYPKTYGKGEWVAETMEDAKEMAMTFATNIS